MNPVQDNTAGRTGSQPVADGQPEARASLGPWQVSIAGLDKASLLIRCAANPVFQGGEG